MFGFKIKNANGKEIILGREESYLLYKSGTIYHQFYKYPDARERQLDIIPGIHRWMNPMLFVAIEQKLVYAWIGLVPTMNNNADIINEQMRLQIGGYSLNSNIAMNIAYYIFLPAKYVPMPKYGLALYNESNTVAFHNGAKPLTVQGVRIADTTINYSQVPNVPHHRGVNYARDDRYYAYRSHYNYCIGYNPGMGGYNGYIHQNMLQYNRIPYIRRSDY